MKHKTKECDGIVKTLAKHQVDSKEVVNNGAKTLTFTKDDVQGAVQKAKRYDVLIGDMISKLQKM